MTTAVFDTLKAFSKLEAAGMETGQAKAVVDTLAEAFDDTVATKANLAEVKTELKADIADLRAEIKGDIANLGQEIAGLKSDFKIFKFLFAAAVILLLPKIAFFS